jgi:alanine dehydrogenase
VSVTPAGGRELVDGGRSVFVERGAGDGAGFSDVEYAAEGAVVVLDASAVFASAELIVKVKEPQPAELELLTAKQVLFAYLHLAADADMAKQLVATGAICIGYETVEDADGRLPLLAPMSEIAGRLAAPRGAPPARVRGLQRHALRRGRRNAAGTGSDRRRRRRRRACCVGRRCPRSPRDRPRPLARAAARGWSGASKGAS